MLSINAGVSEEAGFRGYLQGGLERRYGPVVAIVATSILFWLAHFNHPSGPARVVLLIGYGLALGALTWAVQSIWPALPNDAPRRSNLACRKCPGTCRSACSICGSSSAISTAAAGHSRPPGRGG